MLIDALLHFVKACHNEVSTKQVPLPLEGFCSCKAVLSVTAG